MNLLKRLKIALLLVVVFSIVGCGTLSERGEPSEKRYSSNYYYPGVQYDWGILTLKASGSYDYTAEFCYLSIVCPFIVVLGMPVDFLVDTMLLYNDHKRKLIADREFEGYLLDKYCQADNGLPDKEKLEFYDLDVSACPVQSSALGMWKKDAV
ncbi:TPA: YceK/YidQ family lipoprotein [Pseudomonas putida]|nr:YceK/YidQ family lipoprotein [Pseudomonas putida]